MAGRYNKITISMLEKDIQSNLEDLDNLARSIGNQFEQMKLLSPEKFMEARRKLRPIAVCLLYMVINGEAIFLDAIERSKQAVEED